MVDNIVKKRAIANAKKVLAQHAKRTGVKISDANLEIMANAYYEAVIKAILGDK